MKGRYHLTLSIIVLLIICLITGCTGGKFTEEDSVSSGDEPAADSENKELTDINDDNLNPPGVLPIVKEPIELSIYAFIHPFSKVTDYRNNYFTEWLEEKTNIRLDFVIVPEDEIYTRLTLLLTSEELPDILLVNGFDALTQDIYGERGIILALNDYIEEYGTETKKMFELYPEVREALVRSDGKIYCLPQISDPRSGDSPCKFWIYEPFLEALGMEMPATTDELYDYLKAVKTGDPNGNGKSDEIPLAGCTAYYTWSPVTYLMNAFIYDDNNEKIIVNNGVLEPVYIKDEYKEGLKYIHQLYKEELIMPETFINTFEQLQELVNNPTPIVGMLPTHAPFIITEDRAPDYKVLPPVKGPTDLGGYASTNYTTNTTGPVISGNCRYPEAAFRLLDFFYTEEASISVLNGIRGVEWDYNHDPNLLTDDGKTAKSKALTHSVRENSVWPMITNFHRPPSFTDYWVDDSPEGRRIREEAKEGNHDPRAIGIKMFDEAQKLVYANYAPPDDIRFPQVILFTEDEGSEVAELRSGIHSYLHDMKMQFIMGEMDIDAEWDSYIRQLEQLGLDRYMELNQRAYDRQYK
jgi:putative aldouronate transport system substrate-binding protein